MRNRFLSLNPCKAITFVFLATLFAFVGESVNLRAGDPAANSSKPSKFDAIEQAVEDYFQAQKDFQPAGIITREQVEPLLPVLKKAGMETKDPKSLLEKLPKQGDFLVDELRSPAGRKFAERINDCPNGYDRLDRLSRLPHGKQTVHDLITGPGGDEMIKYMTTAPGGKEMGKMLSQAPKGSNFNQPTGRIYTVDMLVRQLEKEYRAAGEEAGKGRRSN
jgi:hypothetical protein